MSGWIKTVVPIGFGILTLLAAPCLAGQEKLPAAGNEYLLGKWVFRLEIPNSPLQFEIEIKQVGNALAFFMGGTELKGSPPRIQGNEFTSEANVYGQSMRVTGTFNDGKMSGFFVNLTNNTQVRFTAERKIATTAASPEPSTKNDEKTEPSEAAEPVDLNGRWKVVAATYDGDLEFEIVLRQAAGTVNGSIAVREMIIPLQRVTYLNNMLRFEMDYAGESLSVEATSTRGRLKGKWSGTTTEGAWSAVRISP